MTNLGDKLISAGVVPLDRLNLNRHDRRKARATNTWPGATSDIRPVTLNATPKTVVHLVVTRSVDSDMVRTPRCLQNQERKLIMERETMKMREFCLDDVLIVQLLEMVGAKQTDKIVTFYGDARWDNPNYSLNPDKRRVPKHGWSVFMDDETMAFYKDGRPVCGMYSTSRLNYFQYGAYILDGNRYLYAHNMPGIAGRSSKVDTWEDCDKQNIDAQIARDWLVGDDDSPVVIRKVRR